MLVCRVLGPTEVEVDGALVELGGPLPRRLFTGLIAGGGRPVADGRLVDVLWGSDAPADASAALRVYVSRLRQALGERHRDLLGRAGSGYVLRLAPDGTDAARFIQAVERGRLLLAEGNAVSAVRVLGDALGLWRGEAFADMPDAELTEGLRARLAEFRGLAVEERAAARLALGDATQAVVELSAAAAGDPYRERLWALLALGLYRSGRQAEALAALRRVRAVLTEELGVDPGTDLQELERRVLAQDPQLLLPGSPGRADHTGPAGRVEVGGTPARAAQPETPAGVRRKPVRRPFSSFHGRGNELAGLTTALAADRLVTLVGPAGVGKTRVAIEYL